MQASPKFAAMWARRQSLGIPTTENFQVTHFKIEHRHDDNLKKGWLDFSVVSARQMGDICAYESCESINDIYQYSDFSENNTLHAGGILLDISQEHIGFDGDGDFDDVQGNVMEFGLILYEQNGFVEAELDESGPLPASIKFYNDQAETEFNPDLTLDTTPARRFEPCLWGGYAQSRTKSDREWNGIPCSDKPAIYAVIFRDSFYASVGAFVGGGIGATKGCAAAAITGPGSYLTCVLAGASGTAIVGGSVMFGVKLLQMERACSMEPLIGPLVTTHQPELRNRPPLEAR